MEPTLTQMDLGVRYTALGDRLKVERRDFVGWAPMDEVYYDEITVVYRFRKRSTMSLFWLFLTIPFGGLGLLLSVVDPPWVGYAFVPVAAVATLTIIVNSLRGRTRYMIQEGPRWFLFFADRPLFGRRREFFTYLFERISPEIPREWIP